MNDAVKAAVKELEARIQNVFNSGKYEEYLRVCSRFHQYSFNKVILILLQFPEATAVASYRTWNP